MLVSQKRAIAMMSQLDWLWDCALLQYLRSVSDSSILYAVIAFSVVIFLWEEYLAIRQVSILGLCTVRIGATIEQLSGVECLQCEDSI